jgi:hypothetical protein
VWRPTDETCRKNLHTYKFLNVQVVGFSLKCTISYLYSSVFQPFGSLKDWIRDHKF